MRQGGRDQGEAEYEGEKESNHDLPSVVSYGEVVGSGSGYDGKAGGEAGVVGKAGIGRGESGDDADLGARGRGVVVHGDCTRSRWGVDADGVEDAGAGFDHGCGRGG